LHAVTRLLTTHTYIVVIALDFSKAFDNVRHSTLLNKMTDLDIPDDVYNWLVSYFSGHSRCTRYGGESSALLEISAGIIQGSGIGPASYVVNSSDLAALTLGNFLCKYADDVHGKPLAAVVECESSLARRLLSSVQFSWSTDRCEMSLTVGQVDDGIVKRLSARHCKYAGGAQLYTSTYRPSYYTVVNKLDARRAAIFTAAQRLPFFRFFEVFVLYL